MERVGENKPKVSRGLHLFAAARCANRRHHARIPDCLEIVMAFPCRLRTRGVKHDNFVR
jgi:hypothetical protein